MRIESVNIGYVISIIDNQSTIMVTILKLCLTQKKKENDLTKKKILVLFNGNVPVFVCLFNVTDFFQVLVEN